METFRKMSIEDITRFVQEYGDALATWNKVISIMRDCYGDHAYRMQVATTFHYEIEGNTEIFESIRVYDRQGRLLGCDMQLPGAQRLYKNHMGGMKLDTDYALFCLLRKVGYPLIPLKNATYCVDQPPAMPDLYSK